jgi:hypothetical protein
VIEDTLRPFEKDDVSAFGTVLGEERVPAWKWSSQREHARFTAGELLDGRRFDWGRNGDLEEAVEA